jgi:hypothetical protein
MEGWQLWVLDPNLDTKPDSMCNSALAPEWQAITWSIVIIKYRIIFQSFIVSRGGNVQEYDDRAKSSEVHFLNSKKQHDQIEICGNQIEMWFISIQFENPVWCYI